jgi:hypothetical protein
VVTEKKKREEGGEGKREHTYFDGDKTKTTNTL